MIFFMFFFTGVSALLQAVNTTPSVPHIAVSRDGKAIAVWTQFNEINRVIKMADFSFEENNWSDPITLSLSGGDALFPQVAVNTQPNSAPPHCLALWVKNTNAVNSLTTMLEISPFIFGGITGAPASLTGAIVPFSGYWVPQLKINDNNTCAATWVFRDQQQGTYTVQAATSFFSESAWTTPVSLTITPSKESFNFPQIALNNQNKAVAVWQEQAQSKSVIYTSTISSTEDWSIPIPLSLPGARATNPQVAINDSNFGMAIWQRPNPAHLVIQAALLLPNGSWTSPVDLSESGEDSILPVIGLNNSDNAVVAWKKSNGNIGEVQAVTYSPMSGWSTPPMNLSAEGANASVVQAAINDSNEVIIIWQTSQTTADPSQDLFKIQAAIISNGVLGSVTDLTTPFLAKSGFSLSPQVGIDSAGDGVAVWQGFNGTDTIIQSSTFLSGQGWSQNPETISN